MKESLTPQVPDSSSDGLDERLRAVPQAPEVRESIRVEARTTADQAGGRPMDRQRLEVLSLQLLDRLDLPETYQGFAMVAVGTAYWREHFAATPYDRRLLLLPHCLRKVDRCRGTYTPDAMVCAGCGACAIDPLKSEAESLGYKVLVAEGTPAVVRALASTPIEAILGVACLESLERCFEAVTQLGVPYAGVPLLRAGCVNTEVEVELVRSTMRVRSASPRQRTPGGGSLLSTAVGLFEEAELLRLLRPFLGPPGSASAAGGQDPVAQTEAIALDWLRRAGKRFRPFITLASYAAVRRARTEQDAEAGQADVLPDGVKAIAVAMEIFHKASLVHDDVEDDDEYRYGLPTIHARYGAATAINTGDFLVGLGYRLVAAQAASLGPQRVTDILAALSEAHVKLCRGQGAELLLASGEVPAGRPADVLAIYALKTAPAFYAAMVAGMRLAGPLGPSVKSVARFCRHMGVAYQILDDLADLRVAGNGDQPIGQDVLGQRPTVLWAFAHEAGVGGRLDDILRRSAHVAAQETIDRARALYDSCGAREKARRLVDKCRDRAAEAAERVDPAPLRDLLRGLLEMVLGRQQAELEG